MTEIDVSKCEFITRYDDCNLYEDSCKYITDCYYKQLQQLKAENEELKEQVDKYKGQTDVELRLINDALETSMNSYKECSERYKQCLDEVEEYCKGKNLKNDSKYFVATGYILKLIKQAKEGK